MKSRRTLWIVLLILLLLLLLLLARCTCKSAPETVQPAAPVLAEREAEPAAKTPEAELAAEVLTPATLTAPASVGAGAELAAAWTGPGNPGDYVVIVPADAPESASGPYGVVGDEAMVELVVPIEPGRFELRYVTGRSHTVLGRAPIEVMAVEATLLAPEEVVLGSRVSVTWSGPDNPGDYVTLVARDAPDGQFGNYAMTDRGSPLEVLVPPVAGKGELRYMSGQGGKVLARRALRVRAAEITLVAPAEVTAGAEVRIEWTGPDHAGDYVTVVAKDAADGRYGSYALTSSGSPLSERAPDEPGDAEVRYMSGQGGKVLARRAIRVVR